MSVDEGGVRDDGAARSPVTRALRDLQAIVAEHGLCGLSVHAYSSDAQLASRVQLAPNVQAAPCMVRIEAHVPLGGGGPGAMLIASQAQSIEAAVEGVRRQVAQLAEGMRRIQGI